MPTLTDLAPILFRGCERLMIILFGGLCVYWGFRLFDKALASEGQLRAENKGFKFELKQVAPGVFFALFGSAVLCTGLIKPLTVKPPGANHSGGGYTTYGGLAIPTDAEKSRLTEATYGINRILRYYETGAPKDDVEKQELKDAINHLRSHRRYLVDKIVGDGSIDKYSIFAKNISKNPFFVNQLLNKDQEIYQRVKSLLEE